MIAVSVPRPGDRQQAGRRRRGWAPCRGRRWSPMNGGTQPAVAMGEDGHPQRDREAERDRDRDEHDVLRAGWCSGRSCRRPSRSRRPRCGRRRRSPCPARGSGAGPGSADRRDRRIASAPISGALGGGLIGRGERALGRRVLVRQRVGRDQELRDDLDREDAGDAPLAVDDRRVTALGLQQIGEGVAHDVGDDRGSGRARSRLAGARCRPRGRARRASPAACARSRRAARAAPRLPRASPGPRRWPGRRRRAGPPRGRCRRRASAPAA